MKQADVLAYVEETQAFFIESQNYLEQRINNFETTAFAKTRFLSAMLDRMAFANLTKSIQHLERFKTALTTSNPAEGYLQEMVDKTTFYIQRAHQYMARRAQTSTDTTKFVPVPAHVALRDTMQQRADQASSLLGKFSHLINADSQNSKEWLGRVLKLGHYFINLYSASFGLVNKFTSNLSADEQANISQEALSRLNQIVSEIDQSNGEGLLLTKTSQRLLGCEDYNAEPTSDLYNNYFPNEAPAKVLAFAQFLSAGESNHQTLFNEVQRGMEIPFPEPVERPALR